MLIGSMLSPFCFYKCERKTWIMICGLQLIFTSDGMVFNIISLYQWTISIQWFFVKHFYSGTFKDFLKKKEG